MLIEDKDNPTGMFSKAGRLSIEMFALLQEKDNILSNKKKVFIPKHNFADDIKAKKNLSSQKSDPNKLKTQGLEMTKKVPLNKLKTEQPFSKVISRDYLDQLQDKIQINNQKFGMYHPKYHFIFEKGPFYQDNNFIEEQKEMFKKKKNPESQSQPKSPKKKNNRNSIKGQRSGDFSSVASLNVVYSEPNLLIPKVKGIPNLAKAPKRKLFYDGDGPHEKRFEYLELPLISSSVRKPLNIYFDKSTKNTNFFDLNQSGLQYDVNMDSIYAKSAKNIVNIQKLVPRKFPMKPIYTMDESYADTSLYKQPETGRNLNYSQILKKIPSPKFETMVPREGSYINTNRLTSEISISQR